MSKVSSLKDFDDHCTYYYLKLIMKSKGPPQLIKSVWGVEILIKPNFIITTRYEILTFCQFGPFSKRGGGVPKNCGQKLKFWDFFN